MKKDFKFYPILIIAHGFNGGIPIEIIDCAPAVETVGNAYNVLKLITANK